MTVYQYLLKYEGKYSASVLFGAPVGTGVCHADDLIYLWDVKGGFGDDFGKTTHILQYPSLVQSVFTF